MKFNFALNKRFNLNTLTISRKLSYNRYNNRFWSYLDDKLVYGIMAANIGVFLLWQNSKSDYSKQKYMFDNFTISAINIWKYQHYHTLFTATISQMEPFHLGANMLGLYVFGSESIKALGSKKFSLLYFGSGIFSSLCYVSWPFINPWETRNPKTTQSYYQKALGASGSISAIIMWNILTFPTRIIYVNFIIPVPSFLFGLGFIGLDLYRVWDDQHGELGSISGIAHLGGVFYGAMFVFLTRRFPRFR